MYSEILDIPTEFSDRVARQSSKYRTSSQSVDENSSKTDSAKFSSEDQPGRKQRKQRPNSAPIRVPRGKRSLWPYFLALSVLGLGVLGSVVVAGSDEFHLFSESEMNSIFSFFLISLLAFLSLSLFVICKLNNTRFELRQRCVRYMVGRFSLKQDVIEINYQDIGWVRVSQSLFERALNVGTIEIGAAHSHIPEISVRGRFEPHKYASKIHKRLARTRKPVNRRGDAA